MLRVILDTNVLISALLFGGVPHHVVELVLDHHIASMTSVPLLTELHETLVVKFRFPHETANSIVAEWQSLSLVVEPTEPLSVIAEDPDDNRVLECAVSARINVIVSGDRHLLALKAFRGIPIVLPQAFLTQWRLTK